MDPARYVGQINLFEKLRDELNQQISFVGFHLSEAGKLQKIKFAYTLSEAEEIGARLKSKFKSKWSQKSICILQGRINIQQNLAEGG